MPADKTTSDQAIRNFFTQQLSSLDAMAGDLAEPWKTQFNALKDQYNSVLKGLPPTDQIPAAAAASDHLAIFSSTLMQAQTALGYFVGEVASMKKKHDEACTALNSAKEVILSFEKKVTDGDLVEKTKVTELCSAATTEGMAEGEKKVREEVKAKEDKAALINGRKTALNSAKLSVPGIEDILAATEDEFKAAQAKAATRTAELAKKGFAFNSETVTAMAWASDDEYAKQIKFLGEVMKQRSTSLTPFLTPPAAGSDKPPGGCF
jgi:hypothetical protein